MKNLGIKKVLNKRYKTIQNHKYTLVQKLNTDTFKIHPRSKSTRVQNPPDQNPPGQTREPLTGRG